VNLPLVFGHRGARFTAPENSIPSFLNAVKSGADGVELDVHFTRDKRLVVIHDSTLKRISGENTMISDLSLSDVKKLNIAHLIKRGEEQTHAFYRLFKMHEGGEFFVEILDIDKNKKYRFLVELHGKSVGKLKKVLFKREGMLVKEKEVFIKANEQKEECKVARIPELSEALNAAKGIKVNIEIKRGESFYPGIIDALIKEVEPFGFDNVLFSSFNYSTVKEMKRRYPFVNANRLYEVPLNPVKASFGVDGVNPFFLLLSGKGIRKLHSNKKTTYPWVVNKANDLIRFMLYGADGIITDRPYYTVQIRKELQEVLGEII
jgi:glycerophosphoryl diester phosphodiesterase